MAEKTNGDDDHWSNWRTMAGYTYLAICIFDFLIMPAVTHNNMKQLITQADQSYSLALIDKFGGINWQPVTMVGGGLFHLSFGAILTGVAIVKGQERKEIVKQNGNGNGHSSGNGSDK